MLNEAMMLYNLLQIKSPTHFSVEWVAIMNKVDKVYTFNWAKMLSDNLAKKIVDYKTKQKKGQPTPFYILAYVIDAICFLNPFPLMN
jgi:hypothetical protein